MNLNKTEFLTGLRQLCFRGDLLKLWDALDSDGTGTLSFLEFAPEHAMDLARLKQWACETCGSLRGLFKAMDDDGNGKVSLQEFGEACLRLGLPISLQSSIGVLFDLLDDPSDATSVGTLTETELSFLDAWKCPAYLTEKANAAAALAFRTAIIERHSCSALVAWTVALDRDFSMKVNFDEFSGACKRLARQGMAEADPACGVASMYCAIDVQRKGWFTLRDLDQEAYRCLHSFVIGARNVFGKVSNLIRAHEKNANCGVTVSQFLKVLKDKLGMHKDAANFIYYGLASHERGPRLFPAEVLFLDKWDPDLEMHEDAT